MRTWLRAALEKALSVAEVANDIAICSKELFIEAYPVVRDEIRYRISPKKRKLAPGDLCAYTAVKHNYAFLYKGMVFEPRLGREVPLYKPVRLEPNSVVMFNSYLNETFRDTLQNKCEVFYGENTYVVGYPKSYIHTRHMIPDDVLEKLL